MSPSSRPRKLALVLATTALVAAPAPAIAMPAGPDAPVPASALPAAPTIDVPSLAGMPALEAARSLAAAPGGEDVGGLPELVAVWAALAAVAAGAAALGRPRAQPFVHG